jgi:hypothetical protein
LELLLVPSSIPNNFINNIIVYPQHGEIGIFGQANLTINKGNMD